VQLFSSRSTSSPGSGDFGPGNGTFPGIQYQIYISSFLVVDDADIGKKKKAAAAVGPQGTTGDNPKATLPPSLSLEYYCLVRASNGKNSRNKTKISTAVQKPLVVFSCFTAY